jgi:UPF0176 protein
VSLRATHSLHASRTVLKVLQPAIVGTVFVDPRFVMITDRTTTMDHSNRPAFTVTMPQTNVYTTPNEIIDCRSTMPEFVNIAAYKFATLDRLPERRIELQTLCADLQLKGTILLSPEGINMFVAGPREAIDRLLEHVRSDPLFTEIEVKESFSDHQPFNRMLVRIKNEIIAFGVAGIDPRQETSPRVTARQLKQWLDDGKDIALLDVRNDYEVEIGTFAQALPVGVDHFREFPDAIRALPDELKDKPVVTFCTGGIRCEKAGPLMEREGFSEVYQLDGGILKYFEEVGGEYYDGDCFVFDQRVALDADLKETEIQQCFACLSPLSLDDQQSEHYIVGHSCPHCFKTPEETMARIIERRHDAIKDVAEPLPGSQPYENRLVGFAAETHTHASLMQPRNPETPCRLARILTPHKACQ